MIAVTNNAASFFDSDKESEILIYGAGNAGKWVGYFLTRVGIEFSAYLDGNIRLVGALLNEKPIYAPDRLALYKNRSIKIIVCGICYKEICSDLLWLEKKYGFNALLLVPQYTDFVHHDERYNINKLLGYFRRQLIGEYSPTIISNDCTAGFLYEALGMIMRTPTINTGFSNDDYIKVCHNPAKYLMMNPSDFGWMRAYNQKGEPKEVPFGMLEDVRVIFGHENNFETISEKWIILKEKINWDELIFIMEDGHQDIPRNLVMEFDALKEKHLFVNMRTHYGIASDSIICFKDNWLHNRELVIENNFDLVGWITT